MAKFQSDVYTGKRSVPQPDGGQVIQIPVQFTFPAAIAASDLLELVKGLPIGVRVIDFDIISPQLDSNGTPTLAFSIGEENAGGTDLGVVWEAGLIFGRTAGGSVSRASTAAQQQAAATAERNIALKVTTGAATAAYSGKVIDVILHAVST